MRFFFHVFCAVAPLLLTACIATPPLRPLARSDPAFPAIAFFTGRSEGSGVMRITMRRDRPVHVSSVGAQAADGTLVVAQTIREPGRPDRHRDWRLREVAPGRFAGTLSDAAGPVTDLVEDGRLHLSFRMRGGIAAEQWLTLDPGGRSARNLLVARKFGLPVAVMEETITKAD